MPTADDLFRPTAPEAEPAAKSAVRAVPDAPEGPDATDVAAEPEAPAKPKPSGRIRHDEKMTVYVTSDELLHIEQARLTLRAAHGLAVDRGRLVREAIALILSDFDAQGDESVLVRRLTEE